tara:strand:+ start:5136 stop:6332 length:1197 start_codon:yes stop_codon:yes gene_type:complete
MANLSIDQIIEQVGTQLAADLTGNNTLQIGNGGALGAWLNQNLRPQVETLMATQAAIDSTVSKAFSKFNMADDMVENVMQKVTTPLWSANSTSSLVTFYTSSTQTGSAQGKYYWDLYNLAPGTENSAVQMSVTYGHYAGSGSGGVSDNRPYKAIYSQHVQTVLNPGDTRFTFSPLVGTTNYEDDFYAINVSRNLYKERIDPGNWELSLTGSVAGDSSLTAGNKLHLTDDSGQSTAAGTGSGARVFNIVSGTIDGGQVGTTKYGFIYPDVGLIILSGQISASVGWTTDLSTGDAVNHGRFRTAMNDGGHFKARSEEDVTSTHYFCRIHSSEYNYTNNPTWANQTTGVPVNDEFKTDPKTYISTVGLYNDAKELLAVAKLSKPLLKSFSREAVVKVKLDF